MNLDPRKLVVEFLGTLVLVVIAVGVATETFGFKLFGLSFAAGVAATALAYGARVRGAGTSSKSSSGRSPPI